MGLANREYYRDGDERGGFAPRGDSFLADTPTVRAILVTTVVVYLLQLLVVRQAGRGLRIDLLSEWGGLTFDGLRSGQIWRLVTYAFLHARADLWHLIMNMLMVWWLGSTLERMYGSREFLWFYLGSAVFGAIGHIAWGVTWGFPSPVVGASGCAMAIMMLYAIHFPRQQIYLMGLIPVEMRWLVAFYVLADMQPVLLTISGEQVMSGVAHVVHLGGLLYGWLYYQAYRSGWRSERLFDGWGNWWRRWRASRRIRVYRPDPEPDDLEAELDRILSKIHEHGTGSLTSREQQLLTRASEIYKRRP